MKRKLIFKQYLQINKQVDHPVPCNVRRQFLKCDTMIIDFQAKS